MDKGMIWAGFDLDWFSFFSRSSTAEYRFLRTDHRTLVDQTRHHWTSDQWILAIVGFRSCPTTPSWTLGHWPQRTGLMRQHRQADRMVRKPWILEMRPMMRKREEEGMVGWQHSLGNYWQPLQPLFGWTWVTYWCLEECGERNWWGSWNWPKNLLGIEVQHHRLWLLLLVWNKSPTIFLFSDLVLLSPIPMNPSSSFSLPCISSFCMPMLMLMLILGMLIALASMAPDESRALSSPFVEGYDDQCFGKPKGRLRIYTPMK